MRGLDPSRRADWQREVDVRGLEMKNYEVEETNRSQIDELCQEVVGGDRKSVV